MDELREINRLNDDWDALLRGETREVDPALLRDVMALRDATATPGPSPEFADRLWRELERGRPAPALSPRWQIPRLAIAAVLALVLLGAAVALLLRDDPAEPAGQLAAATEAPVASPTAPPIETPHVAGPTATAPPSEARKAWSNARPRTGLAIMIPSAIDGVRVKVVVSDAPASRAATSGAQAAA